MNGQAIRDVLYAQQAQLESVLRQHREGISIERSPDAMEDQLAAESRNLSAETLNLYSRRSSDTRLAISKLNNGTYGFCEECDEEISPRRLTAQPEAVRCILCQGKHDRQRSNQQAPHARPLSLAKR